MAGLSGNAYMLENFATIETKMNPINDNVNIIPVVCPRNRECLKKKKVRACLYAVDRATSSGTRIC